MATTYKGQTQVEMRATLRERGLVDYGPNDALKGRLEADDSVGRFEGDLSTMSDQYLRDACKSRLIPSTGGREELLAKIQRYNARKDRDAYENEEGSLNATLPRPEDKLGKPTGGPVRGELGSGLYHKGYSNYLKGYREKNGTTEKAVTLGFYRSMHSPYAD